MIRDLLKALNRTSDASASAEANALQESTLVQDATRVDMSYHEKIIIKGTTLIMGLVAIGLALYPPDIVVWVNLFAFGGLESAFLWPVLLGLFWPRFNQCGVLLSIIASMSTYSVCMIFKVSILSCHAIVPALLAGLIGALVGTYLGAAIWGQKMDERTHLIFFPHRPYRP